MISIKKLISLDAGANRTLIKVVRILLQGIGQYAIKGDAADCVHFHESLNGLSDTLADGIEPDELLVRVGSILKGLEDHTRRTATGQDLRTAELKNIVKMLAATVGGISAVSDANVGTLGEIEKQLAQVSELTDIRVIKAKLSDCLSEIRTEAERQANQTRETVERLNHELTEIRQRSASFLEEKERDRLTGLSTRSEAEAALAQHAQAGSQIYVAMLTFDRLQFLNERFGRDVGDEILVAFARMIQNRLKSTDQLFRWAGPAFLALLPRPSGLEHVRNEITRAMAVKVEHTIQTRSIDILIPLTPRWTLFPVLSAPRLMYQKLDAFAAAQARS